MAASDDEDDADDDSDGSDASDSSSTAPVKAHRVLVTKRKVFFFVLFFSANRLSISARWRNKDVFKCTGSLNHQIFPACLQPLCDALK